MSTRWSLLIYCCERALLLCVCVCDCLPPPEPSLTGFWSSVVKIGVLLYSKYLLVPGKGLWESDPRRTFAGGWGLEEQTWSPQRFLWFGYVHARTRDGQQPLDEKEVNGLTAQQIERGGGLTCCNGTTAVAKGS